VYDDCRRRITEAKAEQQENETMRNLTVVTILSLLAFAAFGQSAPKWQVGTITVVKPHPAAEDDAPDGNSYDVSVKVAGTIYVVLYTTPLGELPPKYAAGHELLLLVGKNTITYNDMLGRSFQVPIESQGLATDPKHAK
jgi:hypothetical protein